MSDEIDKVLNSDEDPLSVIDTLKRPGTKPKFMTPTYSNENTKEEVSNNTSQEVKVLEKGDITSTLFANILDGKYLAQNMSLLKKFDHPNVYIGDLHGYFSWLNNKLDTIL